MAFSSSSALRAARRSRRSASRLSALALLAAALWQGRRWGPSYVVKGLWEGQPGGALDAGKKGDFGTILQGLEPNVTFPDVAYSQKGLSLAVTKGHLVADYMGQLSEDTAVNFRIDDEQDWTAALAGHDATLKVKGHAADADTLSWEASQASHVKDVGDVKLEFNSDKDYTLTVDHPGLANVAGIEVDAKVKATNGGLTGRLGAKRQFPKGLEVSYSVENPVGVYEIAKSKHIARLAAPIAKGVAVVQAQAQDESSSFEAYYASPLGRGVANVSLSEVDGVAGYNVSYAINHKLGGKVPADLGTVFGVDRQGVYGTVTAVEDVRGLQARYEAGARVALDDTKTKKLRHSLKLASDLGYIQLLQGTDEPVRLRVGYEFDA